jgi:hypothetical protein
MEQSGWCPDHAICMEWIEHRAVHLMLNGVEATHVYMSHDVYVQFMKQMEAVSQNNFYNTKYGPTLMTIMTHVGPLNVKRVPHLSNFCFVGEETSFKRLEWEQISQEFEKVVFGEKS